MISSGELHEAASKVTGLDDFGPDDYTDGLEVLLRSYADEADLTPRGEKVARAMLRGALAARLVSEAGWRAYPEHGQVRLDRPLFVTGLPRTGTTALHRLLTADPAHQGLELWLAEAPQPRPPRDSWEANPVFRYIQAGCERHHVEHPEFMGVHYMAADQVEECWQLLRQSMRSISWECLAHLPSYSAWLARQDWTGAYRRHRRDSRALVARRNRGSRQNDASDGLAGQGSRPAPQCNSCPARERCRTPVVLQQCGDSGSGSDHAPVATACDALRPRPRKRGALSPLDTHSGER